MKTRPPGRRVSYADRTPPPVKPLDARLVRAVALVKERGLKPWQAAAAVGMTMAAVRSACLQDGVRVWPVRESLAGSRAGALAATLARWQAGERNLHTIADDVRRTPRWVGQALHGAGLIEAENIPLYAERRPERARRAEAAAKQWMAVRHTPDWRPLQAFARAWSVPLGAAEAAVQRLRKSIDPAPLVCDTTPTKGPQP